MVDSGFPARLAEQQLDVLRAIYAGLRRLGQWPPFSQVDRTLYRETGMDVNEVAATLPGGLTNVSVRQLNPDDQALLSIAGLAYLPEAGGDLDLFLRALWHAIAADREWKPGPDDQGADGPLFTSEELGAKLGASQEQLKRLHTFLRDEPWTGSGSWDDNRWEFRITREVRRYKEVRSIPQYITLKQQAFTRAYGPTPIVPAPVVPTPNFPAPIAPAPIVRKAVFVIMPFDSGLDAVHTVIKEACTSLDVQCLRSDEIDQAGRITEQLLEAIQTSDLVVADISGRNPNVMYELGYAHALKKQVIVLNSTPDAPFDIADYRWISYSGTDLSPQQDKLVRFLRNTLRLKS